ncbi:hypothetical protein BJX63DRAFT_396049 [Aspergillus granulosus]|uniref:SsDNA binding protein n=1 Tax=Aspergillus granulosus TaxID=176169 RepID=A0ABR4HAR4_9EURO
MSAFTTTTSLRSLLSAAPRTTPTTRAFSSSASRAASRIIVTGRLGATPELRTNKNGNEYVQYSIASKELPRNNEPVTQWWRVAANMPQSGQRDFLLTLPKGALMFVEGDLNVKQYTDNNGVERQSLTIVQRAFEVLASNRGEETPSE